MLYQLVAKRLPCALGAFENMRAFLSVDNLCFVIDRLFKKKVSGVYNITDDEALSTNEIVNLIGESLESKASTWTIPIFFIQAFAKLGDVLPFPINSDRLQKLTKNYVVSNDKIKKSLGIEVPFSSRDGLLKTFQSFRN